MTTTNYISKEHLLRLARSGYYVYTVTRRGDVTLMGRYEDYGDAKEALDTLAEYKLSGWLTFKGVILSVCQAGEVEEVD